MQLSIVTCLAENTLPLMQTIARYLNLETPELTYAARTRGLVEGSIEMGFVCGLLYSVLNQSQTLQPLVAPVSLSAPDTTPSYYSYIIVRKDSPYQHFPDLEHSCFCLNEWDSFSGCQVMRYYLAKLQRPQGFFYRVIESGSHMQSIQKVLAGQADCAAIDHTLFEHWRRQNPQAQDLRILEWLGPFPMPPLVISSAVPADTRNQLKQALLEMPQALLAPCDIREFQAVTDASYEPIRKAVSFGSKVKLQ